MPFLLLMSAPVRYFKRAHHAGFDSLISVGREKIHAKLAFKYLLRAVEAPTVGPSIDRAPVDYALAKVEAMRSNARLQQGENLLGRLNDFNRLAIVIEQREGLRGEALAHPAGL